MDALIVEGGHWFRHDHYEIADGYIRPAKGARVERYDPWTKFHADTEDDPPYRSLIELAQSFKIEGLPDPAGEIDFPPDKLDYQVSPRSTADILEWCNVYGLLGILPTLVVNAWFWPRWHRRNKKLVPEQKSFFFTSNGWDVERRRRAIASSRRGKKQGMPLGDQDASIFPVKSGCVIYERLGHPALGIKPLDYYWSHFFPTIEKSEAETFDYPFFLSAEFMELYAEPVHDFIDAVRLLRDAVLGLGNWKETGADLTQDLHKLHDPQRSLNSLISGAKFSLEPDPGGKLMQRWVAPSLLSSLALMASHDLTERRRIFSCQVCGKVVVTSTYQARYCSRTCQRTQQKRNYRARQNKKSADKSSVMQGVGNNE